MNRARGMSSHSWLLGLIGNNQTAPAEPMRQIKRNGWSSAAPAKGGRDGIELFYSVEDNSELLISMWLLWIWDEHCQMVRHVFQWNSKGTYR